MSVQKYCWLLLLKSVRIVLILKYGCSFDFISNVYHRPCSLILLYYIRIFEHSMINGHLIWGYESYWRNNFLRFLSYRIVEITLLLTLSYSTNDLSGWLTPQLFAPSSFSVAYVWIYQPHYSNSISETRP